MASTSSDQVHGQETTHPRHPIQEINEQQNSVGENDVHGGVQMESVACEENFQKLLVTCAATSFKEYTDEDVDAVIRRMHNPIKEEVHLQKKVKKDDSKNVRRNKEEQGPEQTESCWNKVRQRRKHPTKIDGDIISIRNLTSQVKCKIYILIWVRRLYRWRVGHVSLLFSSSNFDYKYFSWFPRDSLKKLFSLFFLPGDLKTFDNDIINPDQPPDFIYEINNLNINVHDYLRDNQNSNYNFFFNNCCTMVINALMSGGAPDIRTSWDIWFWYILLLPIYTPALINKYCMENFNKIDYSEFQKQYENIKKKALNINI